METDKKIGGLELMKRTGRIISLIVILVLAASVFAFAVGTEGGLNFTDKVSYPVEGSSGAAIENFGIKLYFDHKMTQEVLQDKNDSNFRLTDEAGNVLPIRVLYSPKEEGVVLVLFDQEKENLDADGKQIKIIGDHAYTLWISADLTDDEGNTLGEVREIKFKTFNQKRNSMINFVLMGVMYAGIIVFSMRSARKKEAEGGKTADSKVNPYKEAKKTGKSVEEIVEKDQAKKAKAAEKAARLAAENEDDEEDYHEEGRYRVHGFRTVASGGSSYITGRKAEAERRAERAALEAKWAKAKKGKGRRK